MKINSKLRIEIKTFSHKSLELKNLIQNQLKKHILLYAYILNWSFVVTTTLAYITYLIKPKSSMPFSIYGEHCT